MYETEKTLLDDIVKYSNGKIDSSLLTKFSDSDFKNPNEFIDTLMSEILITYKNVESFPLMFATSLGDYTEEKNVDFSQIVNKYR